MLSPVRSEHFFSVENIFFNFSITTNLPKGEDKNERIKSNTLHDCSKANALHVSYKFWFTFYSISMAFRNCCHLIEFPLRHKLMNMDDVALWWKFASLSFSLVCNDVVNNSMKAWTFVLSKTINWLNLSSALLSQISNHIIRIRTLQNCKHSFNWNFIGQKRNCRM